MDNVIATEETKSYQKQKFWMGLGIFTIIALIVFVIFKFGDFGGPTESDKVNITETYLNDLNERVQKAGIKDQITKTDVELVDSMAIEGAFNFSSPEKWLEPLKKGEGGMEGFSIREQSLFRPEVMARRALCRQDKEYCDMVLGK